MKVRMSCNYNLSERDDMESFDFQTEPSSFEYFHPAN